MEVSMSKYDALGTFLRSQNMEQVPVTFSEIERVTGTKLPNSKQYPAWWSNNAWNNVMTKVWLEAGYRTEQVDIAGEKLIFRRAPQPRTMQEDAPMFKAASKAVFAGKHPIIGALKGSFTIESGWDVAKPALDGADLDAMEAGIEKTADLIDLGFHGGSR
jgi:hypothetical protein